MKKIFQKAIVALHFVLALASCSQEVKHQVLELKEYDSISIAIDYPYLSNYPHLTPCVREGELYVVGYNYFEHYFDYVTFARKDNSLRINRLVGLLENWVTR